MGTTYNMSHLAPCTKEYKLTLNPPTQSKKVQLLVEYTNHCYSRSLGEDEAVDSQHCIHDGSRQGPRRRIFDQQRYDLSLTLNERIDTLLISGEKVWSTPHGNFFAIPKSLAIATDYVLFIKATVLEPAQPKIPKRCVSFKVQSAYPYTEPADFWNGAKPSSLNSYMFHLWTGRTVK